VDSQPVMTALLLLLCAARLATGSPLVFRPVPLLPLYPVYWPVTYTEKILTKEADGGFVCKDVGNFKDQENCGRYFSCVKDGSELKAYTVNCPEQLLFNPAIEKCDWAVNVQGCSSSGGGGGGDGPPQIEPVLVEVVEEYECETEGVFADPDDCSRYFACNIKAGNSNLASQFVAYAIDCPPGLAFTIKGEWKGCDWPPEGGCEGLVEQEEWSPGPTSPEENFETGGDFDVVEVGRDVEGFVDV